MKLTMTEIYRCTPQAYVEAYFDPVGRQKREVDGLGGLSWTVVSNTQDQGERRLIADFTQRLDAPGPIRKLIGETTAFQEESWWREGSDVIDIVIRPQKMAKKLSIQGQYRVQGLEDGTSRVTFELEVQARIFGIGGLVEKMALKEAPDTFAKDAQYFNEHLAG